MCFVPAMKPFYNTTFQLSGIKIPNKLSYSSMSSTCLLSSLGNSLLLDQLKKLILKGIIKISLFCLEVITTIVDGTICHKRM